MHEKGLSFTASGERGIDSIGCRLLHCTITSLKTESQKYIFDSVPSLFDQVKKDNIYVLITFADGKEPPALAALKEAKVPFRYFSFNNVPSDVQLDYSNELY